ncbi:MAG TPA: fumarylacetoacetate hydrolase family protein [Herbaspirillum sp.]|nr:fumarylacetoacetate hydrolase family protein [Herbaspirillum sp.]
MDNNRRNLLKVSASAAVGGILMGTQGLASAQTANSGAEIKSVPPLVGSTGIRLSTVLLSKNGKPTVVVVTDDGRLIDIKAAAHQQKVKLSFDPSTVLNLIASGDAGLAQVTAIAAHAAAHQKNLPVLADAQFLSPIPRPDRNIYCVGWNYLDHFEEGKANRQDTVVEKLPDHPVFFTKATHTMNSPFGTIMHDTSYTNMVDWEAELAVIIGKGGTNIPEEAAMDYVYGYSVYNDTTARDVQQKLHGGQWFKGKSLNGHGPMGPWIVTAGGVKLDKDLRIMSRVNGVEKQNASYMQMYFKIPRIIAELSRGLTLEPGDIIATGTPSGVGFARKPQEFLHPGDIMETEITGIGIIRNKIQEGTL